MKRILLFLALTVCASAQPFQVGGYYRTTTAAWVPPQDSLRGWWEADNLGVPKTSGDTTYIWMDQSGNGRHLYQPTASSKPVYYDSGSVRLLKFDGVNDFMSLGTTFPLPAAGQYTFVAVYREYGGFSSYRLVAYNGNAGGSGAGIYGRTGGNALEILHGGSAEMADGVRGIDRRVVIAARSIGWATMYVNTDTVALSSVNGTMGAANGAFTIGAKSDTGDPFSGGVSAVLYYSRKITRAEALAILEHYRIKYGI